MNHKKKYLVVITGPTAVGKTATAIKVAKHYKTEILSTDSRQFYKELNIGVAKPSLEELANAKHHFIGHIPITQEYTAADFEKDALHLLTSLYQTQNVAIVTGGSGLFINALLHGLDDLPKSIEIRNTLNKRFETEGLQPLAQQLKDLDEEEFNAIDASNHRRVIRSLEICLADNQKASLLKKKSKTERNFIPIKIALNTDREALYHRINKRVDAMVTEGLVEEAKNLLPYKHLNALQTVGYKELFEHFEGKITLEKAIDLIKQHSRNYAKRQLTWFRKDKDYTWFKPTDYNKLIHYCDSIINSADRLS